MKADEAATLSKTAEAKLKAEAWERRQREEAGRAQRVKKILPTLVALAMEEITKAVGEGRTSVTLSAGGEDSQYALARALEHEGYQTVTSSERNNYGDSAAPRMQTDYYVKVIWRNP